MPCEGVSSAQEKEGVCSYISVAVHAQTLNLVDDSLVIAVFGRGLHAFDLATHVLEEVLGYRSGLVVCRHCGERVCE
jgi:hypothetical protein